MDAWQPQQVKLMQVGGNTKCKNFFVEYGVWDMPLKERYATKAATYYRSLLRSEADPSLPVPARLNPDDGPTPDDATASPSPSHQSSIRSLGSNLQKQQEQQQQEEQEDDGFMASLQQQAAAASAAAAAAAASVSSTGGAAIDSAFQSVSSFVTGAKEYTAKTIEAAGETNFIEKAKGGFQSGSEWIAQQSKKISSTFAGGEESEGGSSPASRAPEEAPEQQDQQTQRTSSGVLQSMVSQAKELTSRSFSNVSQAVRSGSSNSAEGGVGVFDRAREGLSNLTAAATGWLQPAEIPPPECGAPDTGAFSADTPEKFL